MAAGSGLKPLTNGTHSVERTIERAVTLPRSPDTLIHLHLTILDKSVVLHLTSSMIDGARGGVTMGSFAFAMPDKYNPSQPLSTPLYTAPSSLDFTMRMARLLVRRTNWPCYVGSSIDLSTAAGGGTIDEEMEAFRAVVNAVMSEIQSS